MKYSLVGLDLDGTLLNDEHKVSDVNAEYLRYLQSKGFHITIATGRSFASVHDTILSLSFLGTIPVVCANGARGVMAGVQWDDENNVMTVIEHEQVFHVPVDLR